MYCKPFYETYLNSFGFQIYFKNFKAQGFI